MYYFVPEKNSQLLLFLWIVNINLFIMCKTGVIGVVDVRIIKQQFGILSTGLRSRPLNLRIEPVSQ